ncbi:hypothetical protein VPH49_21730 [Pseudomonas luteola]|uniref:hypothetical protein n=1 Tax=Pseudomonas luteola TaxID=47886 RepID=UPI003A84DE2B
MAKTEVAVTEEKSIMAFLASNQGPIEGSGLGNENVGTDDLTIPRLDLIQMLSPQLQADNAKYIEGAKVGMLYNSLTGDVYDYAIVVNLAYEVKWQVFKKRIHGGGFEGSFDTEAEALAHLDAKQLNRDQYDVSETAIHKCLLLDAKGQPDQPCLIYMSGSKYKISREWNSQIRLRAPKADRFATAWVIKSVGEKNKQGQPYQNFDISFAGFIGTDLYEAAKETYLGFTGQAALPAPTEQ